MNCRRLAFIVLLATAPVARGQSLGIAPGQIDAAFKPGVAFELELNIANYGSSDVELHTEVRDFWYNATTNEKTFAVAGSSPRSAANWIQFVPRTFHVAPNAVQKIKAIVTPPGDAKGGYYAALFVESTPLATNKRSKDGRAVFTNLRLGCLVLLRTQDDDAYDVAISNLQISPPTATHELTATFDVDNRSNTHIFALPRLAILDSKRNLVAKARAEEKRYLPAQKATMTVNWSGSLPSGDYIAVVTLIYAGDHVETKEVSFRVP
ncbi:MAG TPA: hypothetical protein VJ853_15290 [Thermoanaerobaculia bacterium]|nr:hypothetical protein [Thermoanaerobaculia bacterium]